MKIDIPLFQRFHKGHRRELLFWIPKLMAWESRGNFWISFVEGFFNWRNLLMEGGMIVLVLDRYGVHISLWFVAVAGVILGFGYKIIKIWVIGQWDYKRGIWKLMAEWGQKDKVVNPFNDELVKTLNNICEKVGAKSEFKEL